MNNQFVDTRCHICKQAGVQCSDPTCTNYMPQSQSEISINVEIKCLVCQQSGWQTTTCNNKDCPLYNNTQPKF